MGDDGWTSPPLDEPFRQWFGVSLAYGEGQEGPHENNDRYSLHLAFLSLRLFISSNYTLNGIGYSSISHAEISWFSWDRRRSLLTDGHVEASDNWTADDDTITLLI